MVKPDTPRNLASIGQELSVQSQRVRDLIGDSHWFLDGQHREFLLLALLRRHAPAGVIATRGFVVAGEQKHERSKEQDILLIDETTEAPLFNQGGLVVSSPRPILGAVSVKTMLSREEFVDAHNGLESLRAVYRAQGMPEPWCASFFYEASPEVRRNPSLVYDYLASLLPTAPQRSEKETYGAELVCTADDLVFKCGWIQSEYGDSLNYQASGYSCRGMAAGILLAHVSDAISAMRKNGRTSFSEFTTTAAVEKLTNEPVRIFAT